uniref:Uncharacterized protein n=1 Tax=Avena sativa TaxID=4498 RepID=A0ACD5Y7K8_AVESA
MLPHLSQILLPSLMHHSSLVLVVFDRKPHHLLAITASFPSSAAKMKIGKAPTLLKKAVTFCKSKTGVLVARFLVLASLRRRMATVGVISHRIHSLVAAADREKGANMDCHEALEVRKVDKMPVIHHGEIVVNLSRQLALFGWENEDGSGCPDWTLHPIFNDHDNSYPCHIDECEVDGEEDGDDDVLLNVYHEDGGEERSVMDVIRNNREVEGLEFNFGDEIDQAANMFITKFRKRMNRSF